MTLREIADLVVRMAGENPQTPLMISCEQRAISFTTGPPVHPCCDGHLDERRRATHSATAEESQSQRVRRTACSSIKEECLTRVIRIGEGHMRLPRREYVGHHHRERNHQSELDSARSAGYVVGLRGPSQEVVWFVAFPLVRQWHWPLPW